MTEIERLLARYARGALSRRSFARRLLALGVSGHFVESVLGTPVRQALAAPVPGQVPARAPRIVIVVLDAFRADYVELAPMPNLQWLMARGTSFSNAWCGQLETMTPASHATISTGATPAHQGVIGFSWKDPSTGQETYTAWYDDVLAGRLEAQLVQHNVNSIPLAIKAADPTARVVALSSEKYYAADAMGGSAADYILYGLPKNGRITPQGIPHHVPPTSFLQKRALTRQWPLTFEQYDELAMTMALDSLRTFDPRVLMINLPGCDTYGHRVGGPATPNVMRRLVAGCDAQLGRLFTTFRNRGILDQTIFVVTGDHGMLPNAYQLLDTDIKAAVAAAGGQILFNTGGSSSYIWLKNPEVAPAVAQHLVDTLPHAPLAHYQTLSNGVYTYRPVVRTGATPNAALEGAYQYLFSTFAGPISPDITLWLDENTVVRNRVQGSATAPHGNHGGSTWGVQHVPLVIAGPGVVRNRVLDFPARLMDIAPTLLTLLGIPPTNMDGIVLADALLRPTGTQTRAYDALAPLVSAAQQAIVARAGADIQAQKQAGSGAAY